MMALTWACSERGVPRIPHPGCALIVHVLRFSTDDSHVNGHGYSSCDQSEAVNGRLYSIHFIGYSSIAAIAGLDGSCGSLAKAEPRRMAERSATRLAVW